MTVEQAVPRAAGPLRETRRRADYNAAEQQFSLVLQQRLQQLLEGRCNAVELLRRYPHDPHRLGVMVTPRQVPRDQLRLPVVEQLIWETIRFVRPDETGGPISQDVAPDGSVVEFQMFSTRYPHIVIQRSDRYAADGHDPIETTWCLRRVQNQRSQTQVNRLLDAANLAFEFLRLIPR